MSKVHHLKTWPVFFNAVGSGAKVFDIRLNDRGFEAGDILILEEWSEKEGYSGRVIIAKTPYVMSFFEGLKPGYVVMSLNILEGLQ